jgi:hypothetical protein
MTKRVNRDRWLRFSQVKSKGFKPWPGSANWRSQRTPPNTTPLAPPAVPSNRTAAYERFVGDLSCRGVVAKIGARGLSDQKSERRTLLPLSPCGRGWLASIDRKRPLIRRFAPPSPTRGEGKKNQAAAARLTAASARVVRLSSVFFSSCRVWSSSLTASFMPSCVAHCFSVP